MRQHSHQCIKQDFKWDFDKIDPSKGSEVVNGVLNVWTKWSEFFGLKGLHSRVCRVKKNPLIEKKEELTNEIKS